MEQKRLEEEAEAEKDPNRAASPEKEPAQEEEEEAHEPEELLKVSRMSDEEVTFEEFLA